MSEHLSNLLAQLSNLAKVIETQGIDPENADGLTPVLLAVNEARMLVESELLEGVGFCQCCGQKRLHTTGYVKPTVRVRGYGEPQPDRPGEVEPIVMDTPMRRLAREANEAEEEARRSADLSSNRALVRAALRRAESEESDQSDS